MRYTYDYTIAICRAGDPSAESPWDRSNEYCPVYMCHNHWTNETHIFPYADANVGYIAMRKGVAEKYLKHMPDDGRNYVAVPLKWAQEDYEYRRTELMSSGQREHLQKFFDDVKPELPMSLGELHRLFAEWFLAHPLFGLDWSLQGIANNLPRKIVIDQPKKNPTEQAMVRRE